MSCVDYKTRTDSTVRASAEHSQYKSAAMGRPFVAVAVTATGIAAGSKVEARDGLAVVVESPALNTAFRAHYEHNALGRQHPSARHSRCLFSASIRAKVLLQPSHVYGRMLRCSAS